MTGLLEVEKHVGRVGVTEQTVGELQGGRVDAAERELAGRGAGLEHRQQRAGVRARERDDGGRDGGRIAQGAQRPRGHQRDVHGEDDGHVVPGGAEPCDHTVHGCPGDGAVVEDVERKHVRLLPDDQDLVARLGQEPVPTLGERLAPEPRERLRRPEPLRGASDEEDPGERRHATIRCRPV